MKALVVSQDPEFVARLRQEMRDRDCKILACLGPINSMCPLESEGRCRLAESVDAVIVDAPTGTFSHLSEAMPAGLYAGRLREACPGSFVILEAPRLRSGPTGGTPQVDDRSQVIRLLKGLTRSRRRSRTAP